MPRAPYLQLIHIFCSSEWRNTKKLYILYKKKKKMVSFTNTVEQPCGENENERRHGQSRPGSATCENFELEG